MSTMFIKGTVIGFNYKKWKTDPDSFASWLICVLETWQKAHFKPNGEFLFEQPEDVRKKYGEVRAAIQAFTNDIHSLSICYHQMVYILEDEKPEVGLKMLYISNLVENYITNIRTIYDLLSVFLRIVVDPKYLKSRAVSTDSLNKVLKFIEDNEHQGIEIFSEPVAKVAKMMRPSLNMIRTIRDAIIHDGKEPIVTIQLNVPYFRIPKNINNPYETLLPNLLELDSQDFPIFPYLQCITRTLLIHMDELGTIIGNDAYSKDNNYYCELPVLIGICIPEFVSFIHRDYCQ